MENFLIAGGDLRFVHMANLLSKENEVHCIGFDEDLELSEKVHLLNQVEEIESLNITHLILPLPASSDYVHINTPLWKKSLTLYSVLRALPPKTMVLAGKIDKEIQDILDLYNMHYIDYFAREELAVLNAVPTAEGVLQIAMEEMPTTIFGSKCLIAGYGRIGKYTARTFCSLGADVTVCARKCSELAWSKIYGCKAVLLDKMEEIIQDYNLIINTIPAKVFGNGVLKKIHKDALLIDLASKPGGVDFSMAKDLGVKTIWALSLPGKTAPITAGEIIHETISNILTEQNQCGFDLWR